jgi:light-regulated signal transduction histidine kinase (bacteriophytochrome)
VPLVADPVHDDGSPLDLTHSVLRSVSAVHLEYMRNMKTMASLRISLVRGEDLWGVLLCHHAAARVADPDLMAAADIVGQVVSLLLVYRFRGSHPQGRFPRSRDAM